MINAFTVDVEDYFQVSAFDGSIGKDQWDCFPCRVVDNTRRILQLLGTHGVRGTFFVLGWVARRFPALISEIQRDGHEIGSHGFWHRLVYSQTPDEFRADLRQSRDVLEGITGTPVTAYRAPSFSITSQSMWAWTVLAEEGFRVDSSVFAIRHDRYGMPGSPLGIHEVETPAGSLWEVPLPVLKLGRWNVPVGGGGYFRLYPWWVTRRCLKRINQRQGQPFAFYTHPWEIDPSQPRPRVKSLKSRFRHYVGLAKTERRLAKLVKSFRFAPLCDVIEQHRQRTAPAVLTKAANTQTAPLLAARC